MPKPVILLSIPALREKDVVVMPRLRNLTAGGAIAELTPTFPCVTCPVQANMTTGKGPAEHGILGNGIYWRDRRQVEMWTAPNDCVGRPQIWDLLSHHGRGLTSAVWFPLHAVGCEADYVCTPAPIHNPDGSESLWCYTRPTEFYGLLRDRLGHFPLMNYWGPLAGLPASAWIADSAVIAAGQWQPDFFYIYLPHLDYAAQRTGPDSAAAQQAVADLDEVIGRLAAGMADAYDQEILWLVAGEYTITPVDHVSYPNRILREAGLLKVRESDDGEHLDFENSRAFALVDHQFSHVFLQAGKGDRSLLPERPGGCCAQKAPVPFSGPVGQVASLPAADPQLAARVADLFRGQPGIAEALVGLERGRYALEHPRSGEVILISTPRSWQAYYWWLSDDRAPAFARTVDIHRKPGYDPVELFFDPATRGGEKGDRLLLPERPEGCSAQKVPVPFFAAPAIPLDARLVKGSHGTPAVDRSQRSVLLSSEPMLLPGPSMADTDVFGMVLRHFGLQ